MKLPVFTPANVIASGKKRLVASATAISVAVGLFMSSPAVAIGDKGVVMDNYYQWRDTKNETQDKSEKAMQTFKSAQQIMSESRGFTDDDANVLRTAKLMASNSAAQMMIEAKDLMDDNIEELEQRSREHKQFARMASRSLKEKSKEVQQSTEERLAAINKLGAQFAKDIANPSRAEEIRGRAAEFVSELFKRAEELREQRFGFSSLEEGILAEGQVLSAQIDMLKGMSAAIGQLLQMQSQITELTRFESDFKTYSEMGEQILIAFDELWFSVDAMADALPESNSGIKGSNRYGGSLESNYTQGG